MQTIDGIGPLTIVDKVVPLWDEIIHGTPRVGLAEGGAAIHASGGLHLAFNGGVFFGIASLDGVKFSPVEDAFGGISVGFFVALVVDEAAEFFDGLVGPIAALHSLSCVL